MTARSWKARLRRSAGALSPGGANQEPRSVKLERWRAAAATAPAATTRRGKPSLTRRTCPRPRVPLIILPTVLVRFAICRRPSVHWQWCSCTKKISMSYTMIYQKSAMSIKSKYYPEAFFFFFSFFLNWSDQSMPLFMLLTLIPASIAYAITKTIDFIVISFADYLSR